MTNPLEKIDSPERVLIKAALLETPILLAGVFGYFMTNNVWLLGGAVLVGSAIMFPAVMRAVALKERQNASR